MAFSQKNFFKFCDFGIGEPMQAKFVLLLTDFI